MKDRTLFWLLIGLLVVTTVFDFYTAITSDVFEIAEANPIYLATGNIYILFLVTAFVTGFIFMNLKNRLRLRTIFIFVILTLYLCMGHLVGSYSNIRANKMYHEDPGGVTKQIEKDSKNDKLISYMRTVGIVILFPYFMSILAFFITERIYLARRTEHDRIVNQICKLTDKLK